MQTKVKFCAVTTTINPYRLCLWLDFWCSGMTEANVKKLSATLDHYYSFSQTKACGHTTCHLCSCSYPIFYCTMVRHFVNFTMILVGENSSPILLQPRCFARDQKWRTRWWSHCDSWLSGTSWMESAVLRAWACWRMRSWGQAFVNSALIWTKVALVYPSFIMLMSWHQYYLRPSKTQNCLFWYLHLFWQSI